MKTTILKTLILAAAAAGWVVSAHATPTLTITDGTTTVTGTVNGDGPGTDTFVGAVDSWSVNVTTGLTNSPNGLPDLDLSSIDLLSGTSASTLTLTFTDTGFNQDGGALADIGGTQSFTNGATITYSTYWNTDNLLTSSGGLTSTPFSASDTSSGVTTGVYSLTEVVTIAAKGAGSGSFDANVTVPDGGTTALLVGLAMIGLSLIARKLKLSRALS
jgi:hypothetical protein